MGDPVTMAVIGASAGAMMNKKDPLKGALLGAAGGYGGATLMGAGSTLGASSALASAPTAGTSLMPGAVGGFGQAVPAIIPTNTAGMTAAMGSGGNVASLAGQSFSPSFADTVKIGFSDVGKYAQQNPVLTQMAAQTGQSLLSQQQPTLSPAGLMRGNQMQGRAPQYQVGVPKVSLI